MAKEGYIPYHLALSASGPNVDILTLRTSDVGSTASQATGWYSGAGTKELTGVGTAATWLDYIR